MKPATSKQLDHAHVADSSTLGPESRLEIANDVWSNAAMSRCPTLFSTSLVLVGLALVSGCQDKDLDASENEHAKGESCDPASHDARHDEDDETDPEAEYCAAGLACERVGDGDTHVCAAPLEIRGYVFDALTEAAIEGAHVAALDETSAPVTDVAVSDAEGFYTLTVPARRDETGEIAEALRWTLIGAAADYDQFPGALRPAIPVNAQDAVEMPAPDDDDDDTDDVLSVIENASTDVALIPLPSDQAGGATISGHIGEDDAEHGAGTLVVAEGAIVPAPHGIADASGNYTIFNVPSGAVTVRGYRVDLEVEPASVDVGGEDVTVDLNVTSDEHEALAAVTGSVNIVNAPGGSTTSVVLVPSSVFIEPLERGPVPFGLRAPQPPAAPDISGAFEISGVPSGTYKVLAAFENDELVRDPDESIAGTQIQEIEVAMGAALAVDESFKVTAALDVFAPGADAPERVATPPTFAWADDSSEDRYELVVYDALGNLVWEDRMVPGQSGGERVELAYGGPALQQGMYYQFRVTSFRDTPGGSPAISRTEDLRGVFVFGEAPTDDEETGDGG
jgi:hypothetical protein